MSTTDRLGPLLSGYMPALPTPFGANDDLDLRAFERLCRLQIDAGATALVVCGTTGEAPTLTADEQRTLVRAAVKAARGRVPVIAGAGANATAHAIALSRDAEAAGADALLSVVPCYNKPTQAGLAAHFSAIASATTLPVILYDIPSRTACCLADETVERLAAVPRVIGLKDATGDVTRLARLRPRVGPQFRLFSGDDATTPAFLLQGGDGCISVTSNVAPGLCRRLFLACRQGQVVHAQRIAEALARLTAALFRESNPVPLKFALSLFDLMSPQVRLPLVGLGDKARLELVNVVAQLCEEHGADTIGAAPGRSRIVAA